VQTLVQFSATCLLGALEAGVLRSYQHVLQRGGRRAPTPPPQHAVDPGPHFITLGVKVLFSHLPASDAPTQLRQRRSQDQAHSTAAQAEQRAFLQ